ncbi:helix-turn-helix domain-containing protein [Chitinophaga sp. NPDC101104]|uniref:helix-turn-helix domain-containing protein n=1 Tax=Chitinophaga sp. NPDC101104 TaxID=3390561 RepID=UPI003D052A4A
MSEKVKAKSSQPEDRQREMARLVGARIRELRIAKGYSSYEDFAYKHDMGTSQFGRYERGDTFIQLDTLVRVIDALDTNFFEFFNAPVFRG